ncbi:hypothetical protein [Curtobacterium oceanosedimentum]|uniref:hypothetical protein n=1 Tax=Curtobacterium oceanosedimentum TaxID=465820 RepID=UPI001CE0F4EC|nr:hypothetical protein [Curtobacterium oceanosedimentum]MCA5923775.1 hypothetical protein [Curtobacterium oceanosedimentum]
MQPTPPGQRVDGGRFAVDVHPAVRRAEDRRARQVRVDHGPTTDRLVTTTAGVAVSTQDDGPADPDPCTATTYRCRRRPSVLCLRAQRIPDLDVGGHAMTHASERRHGETTLTTLTTVDADGHVGSRSHRPTATAPSAHGSTTAAFGLTEGNPVLDHGVHTGDKRGYLDKGTESLRNVGLISTGQGDKVTRPDDHEEAW